MKLKIQGLSSETLTEILVILYLKFCFLKKNNEGLLGHISFGAQETWAFCPIPVFPKPLERAFLKDFQKLTVKSTPDCNHKGTYKKDRDSCNRFRFTVSHPEMSEFF